MIRASIHAFWLAVLLMIGCPPDPATDDDAAGDDDAVGDDDDAVGDDDDAAGDDDAVGDDDDAVGDDDDIWDDDDDTTLPDSLNGSITISHYRMPDGMGGFLESAYFSALFYDVVVEPSGTLEFATPAGTDDCAITLYDLDDLSGGNAGHYAYLDAGALTVVWPGGNPFTVQPQYPGGLVSYQQELNLNTQLVFGQQYEVDSTGGDLSSFHVAVRMPLELTLTSPNPLQTFHVNGALDAQWGGGDSDDVWIYLTSSDGFEFGYIACQAANDGGFSIPGNLVSQLPPGAATFSLSQTMYHHADVDGRGIYLAGMTSLSATGVKN